MASSIVEAAFGIISTNLKEKLQRALRNLYTLKLDNCKAVLDDLVHDFEKEFGSDNSFIDDLALKLAKDIKYHLNFEDAVWLLNQRQARAGSHHFRSLFNCALLCEGCDDAELTKSFNERVLTQANSSGEPINQLIANVLIAMQHHKELRIEESQRALSDMKEFIFQKDISSFSESTSADHVLYLILSYDRMGFLSRKQGDKEFFNYYHRKALNLCQMRDWDLGLVMTLETNLLGALKSSGQGEDVKIYINSLLIKMGQALQDLNDFELRYGCKVLRDAYNDVSVACSFWDIAVEEEVISIGERIYESLKELYGDKHHEVLFIASQLAYNYETFERKEEADIYVKIVVDGLDEFSESTQMIMQAKAKALIHLWKVYQSRNQLDEAEFYCREEIRVNRKHGISHQYIANALRNLAFILKEQGRREEGLNYLNECLQLSKEHNPNLFAFHVKVENEIKKF